MHGLNGLPGTKGTHGTPGEEETQGLGGEHQLSNRNLEGAGHEFFTVVYPLDRESWITLPGPNLGCLDMGRKEDRVCPSQMRSDSSYFRQTPSKWH